MLLRWRIFVLATPLIFNEQGQRYPFKLDDRQTAEMIKFTVQVFYSCPSICIFLANLLSSVRTTALRKSSKMLLS